MKICIMVSNSLKKDPRVIKQIHTAQLIGADVYFLGYRDIYYDRGFLNELNIRYEIIDLGDNYVGKLKNIIAKMIRKILLFIKPIIYLKKIKPDIIHANDFDMLPIAILGKSKNDQKIIYDSHEIYTENIDLYKKRFKKKFISILERWFIHKANCVITVSISSSKYLSDKYKIGLPLVITNSPLKYTGQYQKKSDHFEVLYQGLLYADRGYEEFINSAKYLDQSVHLIVRGHGTLLQKLKDIVVMSKLENVFFEKSVEINEIIEYASRSHVGVVLTKPTNINFTLSISNKIFEYIHAGIPVILSKIPEHVYLNEKYNIGLVIDEITPQHIAEAIIELKSNQTLYNTMRLNAKKMSQIENWENEQKLLISVYNSLNRKEQ